MTYPNDGDAAVVNIGSQSMLDAALQKTIRELVQAGSSHVILDLTGLTDIDTRGIGELVVAHISVAQAGGNLALIHVHSRVRELLRLTGLCDALSIHDAAPMRAPSEIYFG